MKKLMISTALVAFTGIAAFAQTTTTGTQPPATTGTEVTPAPAPDATTAAPATDATTTAPAAATTPMMPPMTHEGYAAAKPEVLTAEALTGARVYDANDKDVGEISSLLLSDSGQVTEAIVDVGGFLGMGEKPVALKMSDLQILQGDNGGDFRVYVSQTKEQLEAMPDYKK
ncbi:PRC-barrel domain-containing protein [Pseudorhodobacter sp.]|uniref:PRC-barrel domain-containing protein n=1 Tax=Pseudorhodobacter sp. TaxID=1934400 RepID=UPI00264765FD|nr:PRC-barrel domain-containing protein [Pseudorhodobacter sp.]MDN5785768.1 PRC-barrel domain-containing protein [Pseudorhodobacter sp.]